MRWLTILLVFGVSAIYGANTATGITVSGCSSLGRGFYTADAKISGCSCSNGSNLSFNPPEYCFGGYAQTCQVAQENARSGCSSQGGANKCTMLCNRTTPTKPTVTIPTRPTVTIPTRPTVTIPTRPTVTIPERPLPLPGPGNPHILPLPVGR